MFLKLCILDPTPEEIESTEKAIEMLEMIWRTFKSSITPKCHILLDHTID